MTSSLGRPLDGRAVHLCIDMQRLFSDEGPWPAPWMKRVLPVVTGLAEYSPERTVFTRFITPEKPEQMPGMWRRFYERWPEATRERLDPRLLDLVPPLARLAPPARLFDKMTHSAFSDGRLHRELAGRNVDTLIVTGSETEMCVLATILSAIDHGYRVVLVQDAICSSSDKGHDAQLEVYRHRYREQIEVAEAEAVLSSWPRS